jgi:glycosyltransferase involved in cell wall biosynthesis
LRKRVLHIVQNLNYGGMERLIAELARRVDGRRYDSHVLVLQYMGRFAEGLRDIATLHQAPAMRSGSLLRPTALAGVIRAIAPDVVHSHSGVWYKASLAARMAGVKRVVHTEHGRNQPDPLYARLIDRRASHRTDAIVAVSLPLAVYLDARVLSTSRGLHVVPNGVDTEVFQPAADDGRLRRELSIAPDRMIIGSIGRLERIKGYDIAIEAYARLRRHWHAASPPPVLVLAGDGSEREPLRRLAGELGVADDIYFLGWRDDVDALHAAFDLFTLTSRSEGTSVSLLEAMSAGLHPIVTDVGGNSEVLGRELRHCLVPAESPDGVAAAWYHTLEEKASAPGDTGRLARDRICSTFDIALMVRAYEAIYTGAAAEPLIRSTVQTATAVS